MDQTAGCSVEIVGAGRKDRVRTKALDRILDLDVEPVDRKRQVRDPARLDDRTKRLGGRTLRLQVWRTAEQAVVLRRRVGSDAITHIKALRKATDVSSGEYLARARIGRAIETHELRREQFLD